MRLKLLLQYLFLVSSFCLLAFGSYTTKFSDTYLYKCQAVTFWKGGDFVFKHISSYKECADIMYMILPAKIAFKSLPTAYGILSIIPTSIPLLFNHENYPIIFMILCAVALLATYIFMRKKISTQVANFYILFTLLGGFGTAFSRLDIFIGAILFLAIYFASSRRFNLAYLLLAVGTGIKYVPAILLIPFFFYQIKGKTKSLNLRDLEGLSIYGLSTFLVFGISYLISPFGTTYPLLFNIIRPVQIESFLGSIYFILSKITHFGVGYATEYGSYNIYLDQKNLSFLLSLLMFGIFLSVTARLVRLCLKNKESLLTCSLGAIMVLLLTSKVLSPQYFIWIIPLWSWCFHKNFKLNILGIFLFGFTSVIYPFAYNYSKTIDFLCFIALFRNVLLMYACVYILNNKHSSAPLTTGFG